MTAPSETFCDEEVRDYAKELFGDLIPDYERIKIPKGWMDIWNYSEYPKEGIIKYIGENGEVVAQVSWQTEVKFLGDDIEASPKRLILQIGDKWYIEKTLIKSLDEIKESIIKLRDDQNEVLCTEGKDDICNYFDLVSDRIDELIAEIRNQHKFKKKPYVPLEELLEE